MPNFNPFYLALPLALFISFSASAESAPFVQCGKASWYQLTSKTASGEMANPNGLTAAHRSLPFGTMVTVRNLANGRTVEVRINDRGPFVKGRVIDVTRKTAEELGFKSRGIAKVQIEADLPASKSKNTGSGCQ